MRHRLALLYYRQGLSSQADKHWTTVIKYQPDQPAVLNCLAWLKAASKNPQLHDPQEAIRLAKRACELTQSQNPVMLDTLAAAYAATGRFDEAVETAEKALKLAQEANQQQLTERIEKRLELYKAGKAYGDPSP